MTYRIPERREDMPGGPGSDEPPITPPKKKPPARDPDDPRGDPPARPPDRVPEEPVEDPREHPPAGPPDEEPPARTLAGRAPGQTATPWRPSTWRARLGPLGPPERGLHPPDA